MKRICSFLLLMAMLTLSVCALAEGSTEDGWIVETQTRHFSVKINDESVSFSTDGASTLAKLFPNGIWDTWYEDDPDEGTMTLHDEGITIDGIPAEEISLQVDRNNSHHSARLSLVTAVLPTGENCIAEFKNALAALTALYGEPDYDPFSEDCVRTYQHTGNLSASWTKDDVMINLSMSRMFYENLTLDYTYLLNYDPADLR